MCTVYTIIYEGGISMALLQEWQKVAYNDKANQEDLQKFWQRYFLLEKGVYEKLLSLAFDKVKLYKNMVDAKADWLYNLPMWDDIFDKETKRSLYLEQKKSGTVVVGKKIGRNDPCPCGSGRKYKQCCGR